MPTFLTFDEYDENTTLPINSFTGKWKFLSNFYPVTIQYDTISYPTVEHAFQASKTLIVENKTKICNAKTPGEAKRLGKEVELRPDWEHIKLTVMENLLAQKFITGSDLGTMLVSTGFRDLIEGNTWGDSYWGTCNGKGENHLGKLLMKIRSEISLPWGFLHIDNTQLSVRGAKRNSWKEE
jgi:ribA/ribD-fused uncharacterized protein